MRIRCDGIRFWQRRDKKAPDCEWPDAPVIGDFKTFILIDGDLNSYLWLTRFATAYYFAFFFIIMPLVGLRETPQTIPATISEPVLSGAEETKG